MQVFYSRKHDLHRPPHEFTGGALISAYDKPERALLIVEALHRQGGFNIESPVDFGLKPIRAIHDEDYLNFLATALEEWQAAGLSGTPMASNVAGLIKGPCPKSIEGKVGYFANSSDTTIALGTWEAAYEAAQCALSAAEFVASGKAVSAFALCRPCGHHSERDRFGGYCYLNNAAIAAQYLLDRGISSVGLLDIDFHHGNGTQAIFYDRADVFYGSVHGDPAHAFPFFSGYAMETGTGAGLGSTLNIPLEPGATGTQWLAAISRQLDAIRDFGAETLVLSLGVDAHHTDPQSFLQVQTSDFAAAGRLIRATGLPVAVIMEGGYGMEVLGDCVLAILHELADGNPGDATTADAK